MDYFSDKEIVLDYIKYICEHSGEEKWQKSFDDLSTVLAKYQGQPTLLNSSLNDLVSPLASQLILVAKSCISTIVRDY